MSRLKSRGWHIVLTPHSIGLHSYSKFGKPYKWPELSITKSAVAAGDRWAVTCPSVNNTYHYKKLRDAVTRFLDEEAVAGPRGTLRAS